MIKNKLTALIICFSASITAMDKNSIAVKTPMKLLNESIVVDETTTVLDIKTQLAVSEGIPIAQQLLLARYKPYWYSLSLTNSPSLTNSTLIKTAMKIFNTNQFLLWLMLKKPQAEVK